MKSSEAPALLIAAGGGTQMVNYRVRGQLLSWSIGCSRRACCWPGWAAAGSRDDRVRGRERGKGDGRAGASRSDPEQAAELADEEQEHWGGGRFNRRLLVMVSAFAVVVGWSRSKASVRQA